MQQTFFMKHHRGHGGDRLGHGPDAGDEVASPGMTGRDIRRPGTVEVGKFAMARDKHRAARPASAVDIALHPRCQSCQPCGVETEPLGITNLFAGNLRHQSSLLFHAKVRPPTSKAAAT